MTAESLRREACLYIQFARAPQAGRVKTRMQPVLDPREACALHCELLVYTATQLARLPAGARELWVTGDVAHPWLSRVASHYGMGLHLQRGADLGERMLNALQDGLCRFRRVVLVGSDCPGLDTGYLRAAARSLEHHDMVWGPATDGGYVLVGATRVNPACFDGIGWGSSDVMAQTLGRARHCGVSHTLLPLRGDIDRPEDLPLWRATRQQETGRPDHQGSDGLLEQGRRLCACSR